MNQVPIGISARHVHLTEAHIETLFGANHHLICKKFLNQPQEFASEETIEIVGPKGAIHHVRVLGPAREFTQLEISRTDSIHLGIDVPVRLSGDLSGTPGLLLVGPVGKLELQEGVIIPARHIHLHTNEASKRGVTNLQRLSVRLGTVRSLILENVIARVSDHYTLEMHIDTDEANAAGVKQGDFAEIIL